MTQQSKIANLPSGWTLIDDLDDTRLIEDCQLYQRGYACQRSRDQKIVTGSWAGWEKTTLDKAALELQERLALMQAMDARPDKDWALLDPMSGKKTGSVSGALLFPVSPAPETMQFAKSNGVALGKDLPDAARRAAYELIERHLILGSWYGGFRPRACALTLPPAISSLQKLYQFTQFDFGTFDLKDIGQIFVHATFLWPLRAEHPIVYGFGAGPSEIAAREKALGEAVQRLAFLDPLEVPESEPAFSPTPDFHQEYFLHPGRRPRLEAWLQSSTSHPQFSVDVKRSGEAGAIDLTPEGFTEGRVVRIMIPGTLPLVFGRFQPPAFPDLPEDFWVHPIV